jgi:hypothetical protein
MKATAQAQNSLCSQQSNFRAFSYLPNEEGEPHFNLRGSKISAT